MRGANAGSFVSSLETLWSVGSLGNLTDRELLQRFTDGAESGVFEILIDRHGPLVARVCRTVLVDKHAADDAYQATFMILMRKANRIWVRDSLGPWLHGVALRVAKKAKLSLTRRDRIEGGVASIEQVPFDADPASREIACVLHEELNRLPEKYRNPVVMCHLEGMTHDQAALLLDWPVGTVRGRLSRARELLRGRLARRGLAPTLVTAATVGLTKTSNAMEFRAVSLSGTFSELAVGLIDGECTIMTLAKLKWIAATLLTGTLVVATGALGGAGGEPSVKADQPKQAVRKNLVQDQQSRQAVAATKTADKPVAKTDESPRSQPKFSVDLDIDLRGKHETNISEMYTDVSTKELIEMTVEAEDKSELLEELDERIDAIKATLKQHHFGIPQEIEEDAENQKKVGKFCEDLLVKLGELREERSALRRDSVLSSFAERELESRLADDAQRRKAKRDQKSGKEGGQVIFDVAPKTTKPVPTVELVERSEHVQKSVVGNVKMSTEARLAEVEKKIDRILGAIESLKKDDSKRYGLDRPQSLLS
jgi:RNA polymerase sigma factor (sigma-70 family)